MAVYRKKLVDKDGNTIIPAVGDIYGTVYEATLSSATAGGRADYEFTPDTPLENNKVYAVKFPAPTVNNATIILGDGVSSGSILVPTVAATDAPNYELLNTDMINDTEPLLLMYSGVQWVCLNQKKKVANADLENNSVSSDKIDWTTLPYYFTSSTTNKTLTTDYKSILSLNIKEGGVYYISAYAGVMRTSGTAQSDFQYQVTGGTPTLYTIFTLYAGGGFPSAHCSGIVTIPAGTTINFNARATSGDITSRIEYWHNLSAIKIAEA